MVSESNYFEFFLIYKIWFLAFFSPMHRIVMWVFIDLVSCCESA